MDAVDFVKRYGIEEAKLNVYGCSQQYYFTYSGHDYSVSDLKQIVDAFELVEENGGLKEALEFLRYAPVMHPEVWKLQDAIDLVEKCQ